MTMMNRLRLCNLLVGREQNSLHQVRWLPVCSSWETQYIHWSTDLSFLRQLQNFCKLFQKYNRLCKRKRYGLVFLRVSHEQCSKILHRLESKSGHDLRQCLQECFVTSGEVVEKVRTFPLAAVKANFFMNANCQITRLTPSIQLFQSGNTHGICLFEFRIINYLISSFH